MSAAWTRIFAVAAAASAVTAGAAASPGKDLHFGEALFFAYQERYFEALQRLDAEIDQHRRVDEPELDSLHPYIEHAEFSVGDFELRYRMHHRAGRAIRAVLDGDVEEPVRNEAAYRLARIHFQKDQPNAALHALDRIEGRIPEAIRDDVEFLRANVYLAIGRPGDASKTLERLQGSDELRGFAAYNLGIALLQDGRERQALQQLGRAGQVHATGPESLAIRDKSNLVLGTLLFEASEFEGAQRFLDRVRLEGPFSNQALLRAGWSDASAENFERALVPWSLLAKREPTDPAVQEAMLALPYAYSKLDVHGRAAVLYERAVQGFAQQLARVDASIDSIRSGVFLEALAREEIRRDTDWVIRLRSLPDAPETFYLMELMASHDFQTALQNYLDLEDLRRNLLTWQTSLDAFQDLIAQRRAYYEPLLPGLDAGFRKLDAQMRLRLEQREHVEDRLQQLLVAPRPEHLATAGERLQLQWMAQARAALAGRSGAAAEALLGRLERLGGVLRWRLETEYHERLTQAHEHLRDLNRDVERLEQRYASFVRSRQAAKHGYVGYDAPIEQLRTRVVAALERLEELRLRQGRLLEQVAVQELERRRERLAVYQDRARFAFADSYDRASKAQAQ